jgi:hypothetical protein
MTISVRERLEELADDPRGTDVVDLERLLLAAGYTRNYDSQAQTFVYTHPRWQWWTLDARMRTAPIPLVERICEILRTNFNQGDQ